MTESALMYFDALNARRAVSGVQLKQVVYNL
jgi:hypothetical protein